MHCLSKQTLCHLSDYGLDWRNTGNGGFFWNLDPTLNPDKAAFAPHVGALRLVPRRPLNRLSGGACVDRPGVQESTCARACMSTFRMEPFAAI